MSQPLKENLERDIIHTREQYRKAFLEKNEKDIAYYDEYMRLLMESMKVNGFGSN